MISPPIWCKDTQLSRFHQTTLVSYPNHANSILSYWYVPTFSFKSQLITTSGHDKTGGKSHIYFITLHWFSGNGTGVLPVYICLRGSLLPKINTLTEELSKKPTLQLHLHLDLNRSTRPGPSSTAKILLPLIRAFPTRVHVSLFRSPSLRGILAKLVPPRFNEGWGTWHAKIYGVDDEVMISG